MKRYLKILILGIVLIFTVHSANANAGSGAGKTRAVINGKEVILTVADTPESRIRGLMFTEALPQNEGMLFVFPEKDYRTFWMKNMKIPLDIIFLGNDKIINIYENVPPCKSESCPYYESKQKSDKVIELNAGFCRKYGVKEGENLQFHR